MRIFSVDRAPLFMLESCVEMYAPKNRLRWMGNQPCLCKGRSTAA